MSKIRASLIFAILILLSLTIFGCKDRSTAIDNSSLQKSSDDETVKLIYVGTNETFSEAQYHLDLLDGSLDEPHIVASIVGGERPKVLKFIDKSNNVIRELSFARNFDLDIIANRYVMVREKMVRPGENYINSYNNYYYDNRGKLLWERLKNFYSYFISPNGELVLEIFDFEGMHPIQTIEVNALNQYGKELSKIHFPTEIEGKPFWNPTVKFSKDNHYLLNFTFGAPPDLTKQVIILFNSMGKEISRYHAESSPQNLVNNLDCIFTYNMKPITLPILESMDEILSIYDRSGNIKYQEEMLKEVAISLDEEWLGKIDSSGNIYIGQYGAFDKTSRISLIDIRNTFIRDFHVVNENLGIIRQTWKAKEYTPKKPRLIEKIYVVASLSREYVFLQKEIDYLTENNSVVQYDKNILVLENKEKSDSWAEYVSYSKEEPRYDLIRGFRILD